MSNVKVQWYTFHVHILYKMNSTYEAHIDTCELEVLVNLPSQIYTSALLDQR